MKPNAPKVGGHPEKATSPLGTFRLVWYLLLMHPHLSQKAPILSRVFDCLTSTNNHFHTFAYLPQSPLSTTLHINDSYNMPTRTDILSEMAIAEPMAANVPVLLQQFFQHNVKHEASALLCCAAGQGCVSAMETLLDEYHADANVVHEDSTPLIKAVMGGSLAAVEHVLSRSELDLNHFNQGNKALCARGCVEIVRVLLRDSRVDRVRLDDRGCSALHCAAENGDVQIVDLLLAGGRIDVNTRDRAGSTALHLAAKAGHERLHGVMECDSPGPPPSSQPSVD
ncbi:ankyrin repeat-containing domain protein [Aspergillus aurantiobrunneus]